MMMTSRSRMSLRRLTGIRLPNCGRTLPHFRDRAWIVNPQASYWQATRDGSPVPSGCYTAPASLLCRTLAAKDCRRANVAGCAEAIGAATRRTRGQCERDRVGLSRPVGGYGQRTTNGSLVGITKNQGLFPRVHERETEHGRAGAIDSPSRRRDTRPGIDHDAIATTAWLDTPS